MKEYKPDVNEAEYQGKKVRNKFHAKGVQVKNYFKKKSTIVHNHRIVRNGNA